jgi:hypothetical protein
MVFVFMPGSGSYLKKIGVLRSSVNLDLTIFNFYLFIIVS